MRRSIAKLLLALAFVLSFSAAASGSTAGSTTYTTLALPSVNTDISTWTGGYVYNEVIPGTRTWNGVPFEMVRNGSGQSAYIGGTITIPVDVFGAGTVYTIMNSAYGSYGSVVGKVEFTGTGGAYHSVDLKEGYNIRDHFNGGYNNTIDGTTAMAAFAGSSGARLDMQVFSLPSAFARETLQTITVTNYQLGAPSGTPFIAAATVASAMPYSITGTVTDPATSLPVGDAAVTVRNAADGVVGEVSTDASGIYTVSIGTTGDYTVEVSKQGYRTSGPDAVQVTEAVLTVTKDVSLRWLPAYRTLTAGWNFISFPELPADAAVSAVLADVPSSVAFVWGFNSANQTWKLYAPRLGIVTLQEFQAGKGWWVFMYASGRIDTAAWTPSSTTVHLDPGWNLVGYLGPDDAPLSSALSTIAGQWSMVCGWEGGQWYCAQEAGELPSSLQPLGALKRGAAYWIRVKDGVSTEWDQEGGAE